MAFWVYLLRCGDGSFYTGHTDDLERRIGQHHCGEYAGYTRRRRPLEVVFVQDFESREGALAMELRIKGWTRRKKQALAAGDWAEISRCCRGPDASRKRRP